MLARNQIEFTQDFSKNVKKNPWSQKSTKIPEIVHQIHGGIWKKIQIIVKNKKNTSKEFHLFKFIFKEFLASSIDWENLLNFLKYGHAIVL